eukprot:TRINITY_DN23653_c0_g1_i7.p1 TRINITY_DN23653_c0_g1~~TRINITY_DN23653_c0_g1_i7.p1  ORF type:complete len:478 (-),score=48.18 TRINITY_DN23653_c0_g1_i7:384-1817(-)
MTQDSMDNGALELNQTDQSSKLTTMLNQADQKQEGLYNYNQQANDQMYNFASNSSNSKASNTIYSDTIISDAYDNSTSDVYGISRNSTETLENLNETLQTNATRNITDGSVSVPLYGEDLYGNKYNLQAKRDYQSDYVNKSTQQLEELVTGSYLPSSPSQDYLSTKALNDGDVSQFQYDQVTKLTNNVTSQTITGNVQQYTSKEQEDEEQVGEGQEDVMTTPATVPGSYDNSVLTPSPTQAYKDLISGSSTQSYNTYDNKDQTIQDSQFSTFQPTGDTQLNQWKQNAGHLRGDNLQKAYDVEDNMRYAMKMSATLTKDGQSESYSQQQPQSLEDIRQSRQSYNIDDQQMMPPQTHEFLHETGQNQGTGQESYEQQYVQSSDAGISSRLLIAAVGLFVFIGVLYYGNKWLKQQRERSAQYSSLSTYSGGALGGGNMPRSKSSQSWNASWDEGWGKEQNSPTDKSHISKRHGKRGGDII